MTTVTDEMLSAFLDGELEPSRADEIRAALSNEPALRARLAQFRQSDDVMRSAASTLENRHLPKSVTTLLGHEHSDAGDLVRQRGDRPRDGRFWPTALAASIALVVGLVSGSLYLGTTVEAGAPGSQDVAGRVEPGQPLFAALEAVPSGETVTMGTAEATMHPVLSFESVGGEVCREFEFSRPNESVRAIACRENEAWRVDFAVRAESLEANSGYQTASASDVKLIDEYVAGVMAGDAFGAETEAKLISNGWRR